MTEEEKKEPEVANPEIPTEEITPQEPAEAPTSFSKLKIRMAKLYPDRPFESDEDYDNATDEYMTAREEADAALIDIFDQHPEIREILSDLKEGAPTRAALAKHYSSEELVPMEGDDDYEMWNKNKMDREKKMSDYEASQAEIESNLEKSAQALTEFAGENGLDEAGLTEFVNGFQSIFDEYNNGTITKETLALIQKGQKYDSDVAAAREEGVIEGRNEQIAAKKVTTKDDGVPSLGGGSELDTKPKTRTPVELGVDYINKLKS